jgi:RNA-binding protein YhbY
MKHPTEEQFVLYYYGEGAEIEEHVAQCEACRAQYQALQRVLNSVDSFPVPERAPDYESRVWAAVEKRMEKRSRWLTWGWRPLFAAAAVAMLVIGAFLAGRGWHKSAPVQMADNGVRERVLLVAVGDHLERSQMVLVELANAGAPAAGRLDISYEQQTAEDLLESNRLYRQTAARNGDVATAALLEELERVLLEIAHSPSEVSARQLEELRRQIEDRGILFKVKVFGSRVEQSPGSTTGNTNSL